MLLTKLQRVLRAGFVAFWRNGFVSLASILIMSVTLIVIGGTIFMNALLTSSLNQIRNRVDVNVYFVTTAAESDILVVKQALEAIPEVRSVEYISRDDALTAFKERHKNDQLTLQALDELGDNPLGAALNIHAKDPAQYEGISTFLESDQALSPSGGRIIDETNYNRNKVVIDRLTKIIDAANRLGFVVSLVLIVVSVLITFNTVRLAIFTAREEISVMRLVGASNRYVRGPFVVTGIMYGFISGVVTLLLFYPLTYWFRNATVNFFSGIDLFRYYVINFGQILLIIVGAGIIIGAVSSFLATRRYLKL